MLHHFRRYQQYIYIVVTVVIVISFSFFGTYGTLGERSQDTGEAFVAYNGTAISNVELNEYERFFSSDSIDKAILSGAPGPNFLNDGVIVNDLLEKKLAFSLFKQLENSIGDETRSRFAKEKNFQPYKNPKASFLSAENTWNFFVPDMSKNLALLKNAKDPFDENTFQAKVSLYLGQRRIPAHYLKQVLNYQQTQYGEKFIDPELNSSDLSLFGYRNLDDWFGAKFVKALTAFIINASMYAEDKGYVVTKEEAQADLMRLAMQSYKENQSSPYMTATNVSQYFQEQLRRMQMDQTTAIKIWQRAMLFKRIMQDTGGTLFISDIPFREFHQYASEKASGTLYALPEEFRLRTPKDLELLEVYLEAISKEKGEALSTPKKLKTIDAIAKNTPQLVQNGFILDVATVTENDLLSRIGLREMWRFQVSDPAWNKLVKQFPELGKKQATSADDRQAALDDLDYQTKLRVNTYSKKEILKAHPEWTLDALEKADFEEMSLNLSLTDEPSPLLGITSKELMSAIESKNKHPNEDPIVITSKDGINHYFVKVKEVKTTPVVLTFAESKRNGTLEKMLDAKLKSHYEKIRGQDLNSYQNSDGTWKNLPEVANKVAEDLFKDTLSAIRNNLPEAKKKENLAFKDLAPYRLLGYVKEARSSNNKDLYIKNDDDTGLDAQWKLEKLSFESSRASLKPPLLSDMQGLKTDELSQVLVLPEGDVYFFMVADKSVANPLGKIAESAVSVQKLLGSEAEKHLFNEILKKMFERNALNLSAFTQELKG